MYAYTLTLVRNKSVTTLLCYGCHCIFHFPYCFVCITCVSLVQIRVCMFEPNTATISLLKLFLLLLVLCMCVCVWARALAHTESGRRMGRGISAKTFATISGRENLIDAPGLKYECCGSKQYSIVASHILFHGGGDGAAAAAVAA